MPNSLDPKDIFNAAVDLNGAIAEKLGDLADELLERPTPGTNAAVTYNEARKNGEPWALDSARDWHLTKIMIAVQAGIDPTGDAVNAKRYGATWQQVADTCGVTRQAAYDRWNAAIE